MAMYRVPVERVGVKSLRRHRAHKAGRLSDLLEWWVDESGGMVSAQIQVRDVLLRIF